MRKKVLKLGVVLAALLLAALLGTFLYGLTLPKEISFTRSMQLRQPPQVVFAVAA